MHLDLGVEVRFLVEADFEKITRINYWGVIHTTQRCYPHLLKRPEAAIVNLSSSQGILALPYLVPYCTTKFAVRGFTEALRQELELQKVKVSATSVHPGGIKTNIARAARMDKSVTNLGLSTNSTEKFEKLFSTTADDAAAVIIKGVEKNQRRVLVGNDAKVLDLMVRLFPSTYQKLVSLSTKTMK